MTFWFALSNEVGLLKPKGVPDFEGSELVSQHLAMRRQWTLSGFSLLGDFECHRYVSCPANFQRKTTCPTRGTLNKGDNLSECDIFGVSPRILTLLVLKNGLPAAVFGFFGAVVGCLLCIFRVLPVGAAQQAEGQWYLRSSFSHLMSSS